MSKLLEPTVDNIFAAKDKQKLISLLDQLLLELENPDSFLRSCKVLHDLANKIEFVDSSSHSNLSSGLVLNKLQIPGLKEPLRIFLTQAVFSPEFWGRTFAEGLLKSPEIFEGKKIVELGTGSGWISLLLLFRTGAASILGLDINPIAVTLANLNKWLNGTYADGSLKLSKAGLPIVKSFHAEVSDLLEKPLSRREYFDRVIGCIPQVLHPEPEKIEIPKHELSEQDLYDLSNYCFNQGILEDRYGLPLIARALEEAQLCLSPRGKLTLILGGRPGQDSIEEMFKRRGFIPKLNWVRRIQQAEDTDLVQLVKLEESFGIKFHFYLSNTSTQPVPASTAHELRNIGKKIYHDLLVYQAETQFETSTFGFVRNLHKLGLSDLRKELDFSRISEEQISFLNRLSAELVNSKSIPYPHEKGDRGFREKLACFLSFYCHYPIQPDDLFIGPERQQLLAMILKMVARSGSKILISNSLKQQYIELLKQQSIEIIYGNDDLSELLILDNEFSPCISLLSPSQLNDPSGLLLDSLVEHAEAHPKNFYLIDDSQNFTIDSEIYSNLLLRLLGQRKLPNNLVFLYGLIKNTVCPDFELSFLINAPKTWIDALEICAELSYSRISYIIQLYYEWLFDELLSFPFVTSDDVPKVARNCEIELLEHFQTVAKDPVFAAKPIDINSANIIRMDYGELEAPVPTLLLKGLLKGFLEGRSDSLVFLVQQRICAYLKKTRRCSAEPDNIVLSQGVFPLFGALIQSFRVKLGRPPIVAVPRGAYGPIYPMLSYYGVELLELETDENSAFTLPAESLLNLKKRPDLLWLTQPNNPTGIFMEAENLRKLIKICAEKDIYIFADEIFFLLSDLSLGLWTPAELSTVYGTKTEERKYIFMADGLAKAFAAGGLRCGFLLCPDSNWANLVKQFVSPVPQTSLRAWDRLYSTFMDETSHQLIDHKVEFEELEKYLLNIRTMLTEQRTNLFSLLNKFDKADSLKYARRGGLFTLAKLANYYEELALEENLLINSAKWSRTAAWTRLCIGLESKKFEQALFRLERFLAKISS